MRHFNLTFSVAVALLLAAGPPALARGGGGGHGGGGHGGGGFHYGGGGGRGSGYAAARPNWGAPRTYGARGYVRNNAGLPYYGGSGTGGGRGQGGVTAPPSNYARAQQQLGNGSGSGPTSYAQAQQIGSTHVQSQTSPVIPSATRGPQPGVVPQPGSTATFGTNGKTLTPTSFAAPVVGGAAVAGTANPNTAYGGVRRGAVVPGRVAFDNAYRDQLVTAPRGRLTSDRYQVGLIPHQDGKYGLGAVVAGPAAATPGSVVTPGQGRGRGVITTGTGRTLATYPARAPDLVQAPELVRGLGRRYRDGQGGSWLGGLFGPRTSGSYHDEDGGFSTPFAQGSYERHYASGIYASGNNVPDIGGGSGGYGGGSYAGGSGGSSPSPSYNPTPANYGPAGDQGPPPADQGPAPADEPRVMSDPDAPPYCETGQAPVTLDDGSQSCVLRPMVSADPLELQPRVHRHRKVRRVPVVVLAPPDLSAY